MVYGPAANPAAGEGRPTPRVPIGAKLLPQARWRSRDYCISKRAQGAQGSRSFRPAPESSGPGRVGILGKLFHLMRLNSCPVPLIGNGKNRIR